MTFSRVRTSSVIGTFVVGAAAMCVVAGAAVTASAQSCEAGWTRLFEAPGIPARGATAVASEGTGQTVVLFGGSAGGTTYGDTWVRTVSGWAQRVVAGPSSRTGHLMAFDAARQRTVLFGGVGGEGALGDTWEWDGNAWQELQPANTPGLRLGATLVYAGVAEGVGRVLLVGGTNAEGVPQTDTWSWNGGDWTNLGELGITPRISSGATFDAARQVVVMYGGLNPVGFDQLADTWEFDGTAWIQTSGFGEPGRRENASLAFDQARQRVVLFGGTQADSRTFELEAGVWIEVAAAGPKPRLPLAYHGGLGRVIQLEPEPSRTWAWDGAAWTVTGSTVIPAVNAVAGAWDPASSRFAVFGGSTFLGQQLGGLWTLGANGWELMSEAGPSARDRAAMVGDTARGRLVLAGGADADGNVLADTWSWNGTEWTELVGAGLPARTGAAMAYDPVRDRVVLFGGRDAEFGFSGETWTFDGSAWSQVAIATGPVSRDRAAMTFDPIRGKVVLVGGRDENFSMLGDFWEFDGAAWTRVTTQWDAPARSSATLTFDVTRSALVLTGGLDSDFANPDDTWVFTAANGWQSVASPTLGGRSDHAAAYNPVLGRVEVFGGFNGVDTVGDTWAFGGPGDVVVTQQPTDVAACLGQAVTLAVAATGTGTLSYQWRLNGEAIDAAVNPSAALPVLTIAGAGFDDAGRYECQITGSCGVSRSLPVRVSVASCACSPADIAGGGDAGLQPDGTLDGSDFIAFINSFGIGDAMVDPLADIAGGGETGEFPDGTIDGADFIAFINAFAIGC